MASGWASQDSRLDRKIVGRVVTHVLYPNEFEAAPVSPEDLIPSQSEDVTLSYLCPSIQVPKLAAFSKVMDQINKAKLCK